MRRGGGKDDLCIEGVCDELLPPAGVRHLHLPEGEEGPGEDNRRGDDDGRIRVRRQGEGAGDGAPGDRVRLRRELQHPRRRVRDVPGAAGGDVLPGREGQLLQGVRRAHTRQLLHEAAHQVLLPGDRRHQLPHLRGAPRGRGGVLLRGVPLPRVHQMYDNGQPRQQRPQDRPLRHRRLPKQDQLRRQLLQEEQGGRGGRHQRAQGRGRQVQGELRGDRHQDRERAPRGRQRAQGVDRTELPGVQRPVSGDAQVPEPSGEHTELHGEAQLLGGPPELQGNIGDRRESMSRYTREYQAFQGIRTGKAHSHRK